MSWFDRFIKKANPTTTFTDAIALEWDDYFWTGRTVLPAWAGFQQRLGPYSGMSGIGPSNGEVRLSIHAADVATRSIPTPAQREGFVYLQKNAEPLREKMLQALLAVYPQWRESYVDFLGDEADEMMPVIKSPSDFKRLIGLSTVHILSVEKNGFAYVGFEFGCNWDEEHGLGIMSHMDRIFDVGSAEESFSTAAADTDLKAS